MSALPYFFEPSIEASSSHFELSELTSKHCVQVLRMRAGESLHLTDGIGNLYTASIVEPDKKKTVVKIDSVVHTPRTIKNVCIAIDVGTAGQQHLQRGCGQCCQCLKQIDRANDIDDVKISVVFMAHKADAGQVQHGLGLHSAHFAHELLGLKQVCLQIDHFMPRL